MKTDNQSHIIYLGQIMKRFMLYFPYTNNMQTIIDTRNIFICEFNDIKTLWKCILRTLRTILNNKVYIWQLRNVRFIWNELEIICKRFNHMYDKPLHVHHVQDIIHIHFFIQDIIQLHKHIIKQIDDRIFNQCYQNHPNHD